MNAEQSLALRRLWTSSSDRLLEAARRVREVPTAVNSFAFRRAVALHGTIQKQVLAVRTETARALQQWAIPAGSDDIMSKQISDMVDQFGGEGVADNLAGRIIALAEQGNLAAVDNVAKKSWAAATLNAVFEHFITSVLSGFGTHMVNFVGNASVVELAQIERGLAAGVGAIRGGADRVELGEAMSMLHGTVRSVPDALRFAGEAFVSGVSKNGVQKFETQRARAISTEMLGDIRPRKNGKPSRFATAVNAPVISHGINAWGSIMGAISTRALGASDEFFKTINYSGEIHALTLRQASREAREGLIPREGIQQRMGELMSDIPDDIIAQARDFAQNQTFTDKAGFLADAIRGLKQKVPGVRYILPFVQTVSNIMRFAAERSPGAVLMPGVQANIRAGGARADLAIAKLGLGSVAMLTTFDYAMRGFISGNGPSNTAERQRLRRMGWQPNSVKFGDRYFAYNRLDPFGMQLGVAANLAELAMNSADDPGVGYDEQAYRSIGAIGESMMSKSYLTGLSDFVKAVDEPRRFSASYMERFASAFVPNMSRDIARAIDPTLRVSTNTVEAMMRKIPGLSDNLPPRRDLWGRPINFKSGLGVVWDVVSPIYSSVEKVEPIDEELGKISFFPGMPSKKITDNRVSWKLNNEPEIYDELVVLRGATSAADLPRPEKSTASSRRMDSYGDRDLREMLNALVTGQHPLSEEYDALDDLGKGDMIKRTISDYRRWAKKALMANHPDFFDPTGRKRR